MPTYVYRCDNCKDEIEKVHSFKETPEVVCEKCKSLMNKKFVPISAIIIGQSFREGRKNSQPPEVKQKLEEFHEHPERDPYRKHRGK